MIKHSIFNMNIPKIEYHDGTVVQIVAKEDRMSKTCIKIRGFLTQLLTL